MSAFQYIKTRFHWWWNLLLVFLLVSFLTRVSLAIYSAGEISWSPLLVSRSFFTGFLFDLVAGIYFTLPMLLVNGLLTQDFLRSRQGRIFAHFFFFLHLLLILLNAVSEWLFWNEFTVRYNFIAVDYLVYTNEVLKNIQQSYPMPLILGGLLSVTVLFFYLLRKRLVFVNSPKANPLRFLFMVLVLAVGAANFFLVDEQFRNFSANKLNNELAGNGLFQFGSAFRKNAMPYLDFYAYEKQGEVFRTLHDLLREPGARFSANRPDDIRRTIEPDGEPHKWNVVLISVESLSAEYLDYFREYHHHQYPEYLAEQLGYAPKLTPNLDSLISQSLFFTQLYASGTRTVRGLEALSTGLPPTPGQSVVKRLPTAQGLFTLGQVLKQQGYDCKYVYGGNSFFDNMGDFFGSNGYHVVDESSIPSEAIHHETAWGVCDEDLYAMAMKEMDASYRSGRPFFQHVMTVSHHRPYTYPEGRVSIPPSIKRREGGLQYTDFAIGEFLKAARKKPWFRNTVFVIIADHCADSGGHTNMPLNRYHIPCWIYAPALVKPGTFDRLTSQIDIPPTILGLLNIPYQSQFFGYDMFRLEKGRERLLLVNYQDIGYVKNGKMVVLSPQRKVRTYLPDFRTGEVQPIQTDETLKREAIAYFQGAAWLLDHGKYRF